MTRSIIYIALLVLSFALLGGAQDKAATPELTEVEGLTVQNLAKDFTIASQQVALAQQRRGATLAALRAEIARLRALHNAPEDRYDFILAELRFVPKLQPEAKDPTKE